MNVLQDNCRLPLFKTGDSVVAADRYRFPLFFELLCLFDQPHPNRKHKAQPPPNAHIDK